MYNLLLGFELDILSLILKLHTDFSDNIMIFITRLGDKGFLWIVLTIILLLFKRTRKIGFFVAVSLLVNFILVNLITKPLVARTRPYEIDTLIKLIISPPTDYSFPSGHTSSAFSFSFALFKMNKKWAVPSFILASLIAFSRLYLCVHFPTDVFGGVLFGFVSSYLSYKICNFVIKLDKK